MSCRSLRFLIGDIPNARKALMKSVYLYGKAGHNFAEAVRRAIHRIEGSYALGIMCVDYPDTMIAVKKDSPLIFGYGDGEMFIASDVPAILKYTREVTYLDDGDMVVFDANHAEFYSSLGERRDYEVRKILIIQRHS